MPRNSNRRPPKPPENSEWSFEALLDAFGSAFPRWLRRFGVRHIDIKDATQDVHFALWRKQRAIPTDAKEARKEVFTITAAIAREWYREAQRGLVYQGQLNPPNSQNPEEWIARRILCLKALDALDDRSRDLIIAHELEEKTYEVIAAEQNEKPDTIRKRFDVAYEKLRNEIIWLLGNDKMGNGSSSGSFALMFGFTPFDRAVLRALLEAEQHVPIASPTHGTKHVVASKSAMLSGFPMSVMLGVLVMLPGEMPNTPSLSDVKIADVPLHNLAIEIEAPVPAPPIPTAPASAPERRLQSIRAPQVRHAVPSRTLDEATKASLRGVVAKSGSSP